MVSLLGIFASILVTMPIAAGYLAILIFSVASLVGGLVMAGALLLRAIRQSQFAKES